MQQRLWSFFNFSDSQATPPAPPSSEPEELPLDYVKTLVRVSINEIKCRLVADATPNMVRGAGGDLGKEPQDATKEPKAKSSKHLVARLPEHVLCCIFTNNVKVTLRVRYDGWEVGLYVTNVAVKDYTSTHHKLKYLLRRSEDYYTSGSPSPDEP